MSNARKVSTDALETLGTIIDDAQKRDAIHIAVLPVIAGERLHAGQDVGIGPDGGAFTTAKHTGIVDPFLKVAVQPGQRFWLLLYPRMVTSLRHVWSHPEFSDDADGKPSEKTASEAWLDLFASTAGISRDELIDGARDYLKHDEYLSQGGRWEGFSTPDEFWTHYEIVTGEKVSENDRGSFFSCSC